MLTLPPEPSAKDPISATFVRALMRYIRANTLLNGPGYRTKRGPNGTSLSIGVPRGGKSAAADPLHPWKIFGGKRPESGSQPSKAQRVYVPAESLIVDVLDWPASDIIGLTADGDLDDFYELDCLETLAADTPSIIYLFVYRETEPESEGADPQTYAEVAASLDDSGTYDPGAHEILAAVPLFNITRKEDDEGESVLTVNLQYQHCAIVVAGNGGAVEDSNDKGCFAIREVEDPTTHVKAPSFVNNYVNVAGRTYEVSTVPTVESCAGKIFLVYAQTSYSGTTVGCTTVDNFAALQARQVQMASRVDIPIYKFASDGSVEVDFRNAPHLQLFEAIAQ